MKMPSSWMTPPNEPWKRSVVLPVRSASTSEVVCELQFYGLTMSELCEVPCDPVRVAMERRGFMPGDYVISPFDLRWQKADRYANRNELCDAEEDE